MFVWLLLRGNSFLVFCLACHRRYHSGGGKQALVAFRHKANFYDCKISNPSSVTCNASFIPMSLVLWHFLSSRNWSSSLTWWTEEKRCRTCPSWGTSSDFKIGSLTALTVRCPRSSWRTENHFWCFSEKRGREMKRWTIAAGRSVGYCSATSLKHFKATVPNVTIWYNLHQVSPIDEWFAWSPYCNELYWIWFGTVSLQNAAMMIGLLWWSKNEQRPANAFLLPSLCQIIWTQVARFANVTQLYAPSICLCKVRSLVWCKDLSCLCMHHVCKLKSGMHCTCWAYLDDACLVVSLSKSLRTSKTNNCKISKAIAVISPYLFYSKFAAFAQAGRPSMMPMVELFQLSVKQAVLQWDWRQRRRDWKPSRMTARSRESKRQRQLSPVSDS